jgi:hypothetical protein
VTVRGEFVEIGRRPYLRAKLRVDQPLSCG